MRYILLTLILFLAACSAPTSARPTLTFPSPPAATATATSTPTPAASATPPVTVTVPPASPTPENSQRPRYELRLSLDYAAHSASVAEKISYTNQTDETLNELVLAVLPRLRMGVFALTSLAVDGQPAQARFNGQRMSITLAKPLEAGQSVSLEIDYTLQIPLKDKRYVFGYNANETSLLDWYPFIAPYIPGKGWVLHNPSPVGEHLVYESADFDVYLKFTGTSPAPMVAASAPGVAQGEWTHYHLQTARGFALAASDRFLVSSADAGGVAVTSYYFDGHQAAGAQAAEMAAQAVRLFSQKFAPYPYESLSIVESAADDGMESDGLFFLAGRFYETYDDTLENYLTALSVHETAHQWWYGLVGGDQALEPWLDEALCTYSERIFYAEKTPEHLNWWWYFRVRRFDPVGFVDGDVYTSGSFRLYTNATYFVGAYFLDDLRVRIGDDIFAAFLLDYAGQNAHKIVTAQDFFTILERHTGAEYADLVKQYFKGR